jgi:hypothetical protein
MLAEQWRNAALWALQAMSLVTQLQPSGQPTGARPFSTRHVSDAIVPGSADGDAGAEAPRGEDSGGVPEVGAP